MFAFIVLTLRQWRHPEGMASSLWAGWAIILVGLATPAWWFTVQAGQNGERLVDLLPPILTYLFAHPAELWSPRSFDLLVVLGPLALLVPPLAPLQRADDALYRAKAKGRDRVVSV